MSSTWPGDVFVLIPAYRAECLLADFLPALLRVVPSAQVLVVDDGSGDDTAQLCRSLSVRCLLHPQNRGKGAALRSGFSVLQASRAQWVISMDADGQHSVEDLPRLLRAVREGPLPCLWIGQRGKTPGVMPPARIVSNSLTSWALSLLCRQRVLDSQCGYRAYPLAATLALPLRYERFEMESEAILRLAHAGCPLRFVPIRTVYSGAPSNISHLRDTLRWIRAVVSVWWELRNGADTWSSNPKLPANA